MVTFEEAKSIAKGLNKRVNACKEYEKGYHFYEKNSDADGDAGVVIIKENGQAKSFIQFIMNYQPETNPKSIPMGNKVVRK